MATSRIHEEELSPSSASSPSTRSRQASRLNHLPTEFAGALTLAIAQLPMQLTQSAVDDGGASLLERRRFHELAAGSAELCMAVSVIVAGCVGLACGVANLPPGPQLSLRGQCLALTSVLHDAPRALQRSLVDEQTEAAWLQRRVPVRNAKHGAPSKPSMSRCTSRLEAALSAAVASSMSTILLLV